MTKLELTLHIQGNVWITRKRFASTPKCRQIMQGQTLSSGLSFLYFQMSVFAVLALERPLHDKLRLKLVDP